MDNNLNKKSDKPFWDWMMNLSIVKWFCNLKICKKCMTLKPFQLLFNYEMVTYIFYGFVTTVINLVAFALLCFAFNVPMKNPSTEQIFLSTFANAIAFVISLIFAFVVNKYIVFKSKKSDVKTIIKEFVSFGVARLASFGCETLIIFVAPYIMIPLMIAKVIAQIVVVILNYIFSKLFIFKKDKGDK